MDSKSPKRPNAFNLLNKLLEAMKSITFSKKKNDSTVYGWTKY